MLLRGTLRPETLGMLGQPFRTTQNRIIAVYRDKEPYDGDWKNGCPAKYIGYDLYREPLLQETNDFHS